MINHGRKAIEALRTGVPIREVIDLLGSGQPELENRFIDLLKQKKEARKPIQMVLYFLVDLELESHTYWRLSQKLPLIQTLSSAERP